MMRSSIAIVLVEPENPDNIGASARAMKNMGLSHLRLVKPPIDWKRKAKKMAMSAYDLIESAEVYSSLKETLEDIHWVIGTTRRSGAKRGVFLPFEKTIQKVKANSKNKKTAILFGKESKGLDNRSLSYCDWITTIPASPVYPSLNLAQAVLVVAFSLFQNQPRGTILRMDCAETPLAYVPKKVTQDVLQRFRQALAALEYEREGRDVMDRISATLLGLLKRNGLLEPEAQMIKGISRRICERIKNL